METRTGGNDLPLAYDAIIATRNRPEALALSLPLLAGQTRPPARIIVIDSSDDPADASRTVGAALCGWSGEVILRRSPPGLPGQRNIGLSHSRAPVVFFVDDDSLLYPDAAEAMLAVYERDTEGRIAAVCAAEAMSPPETAKLDTAYGMSRAHRLEARVRALRNLVERRLTVLKPAMRLGRELNARHPVPDWLAEEGAVVVEYMTGFRMSFRTEAIRGDGFDETLSGYALDEDIDASFTAARQGLVVGAQRARIFHHRCPSGRADGFGRGRMEVLNRAYVLLKHASGSSGSAALTLSVWRLQAAFVALKLASLLPRAFTPSGRARLAGAWAGYRHASRLWDAAPGERSGIVLADLVAPRAGQES